MRITLGPVLYHWPRDTLLAFYDHARAMPLDVVYLGETVCSKRRSLRVGEWLDLARGIAASGRQAVLSTLTLIEAASELSTVRRLCGNGEFLVEANDVAAVQRLSEQRLPFVAGPGINIYSAATLGRLAKVGLQRWVAPAELSRQALAALLVAARRQGHAAEAEVLAFGRLPLACSARCFTARYYNLPKDDCQWRCLEHPEGIRVSTQEGEGFLTLNGIQTQSGRVHSLLDEWRDLGEMGVGSMRISPQPQGTGDVVAALRERLDGGSPARQPPDETCNGYWFGRPGMVQVQA
jgi:O2-independent ubiquinone biosynthesis protein UbiV